MIDGLENRGSAASARASSAIVVASAPAGANVIETVQRIKNELPKLQRSMPVGATLTIAHDATKYPRRATCNSPDLRVALVITVVLIFRTVRHHLAGAAPAPLADRASA